jgi:hypothetical protein
LVQRGGHALVSLDLITAFDVNDKGSMAITDHQALELFFADAR